MSLFSRFFGKAEADDMASSRPLTANPNIERPLSLQVLFPEYVPLDSQELVKAFKSFHSSMEKVRCEIDPALQRDGKLFGLIGWAEHVIKLVGFDAPMPAEAVESCIAPSHYPEELKAEARSHQAHILVYYAGYDESPVEQYVALAATAGVLARFGAIVMLNESGHTSFPAAVLSGTDSSDDMIELLRTLPRPILYCGFVKHEVEGIPGVWMRTYGAPLLGFPDLAAHASGHHEGERYFGIFNSVFGYLEDSGKRIAAGHTMQIDEDEYLRFREVSNEESFLDSTDELLVLEIIAPDQINRPGDHGD
jgi:hypothetical protein